MPKGEIINNLALQIGIDVNTDWHEMVGSDMFRDDCVVVFDDGDVAEMTAIWQSFRDDCDVIDEEFMKKYDVKLNNVILDKRSKVVRLSEDGGD